MEAPKKTDVPFFSEFSKIIFGILIGLASFQVLAPLIWNYLSDLLHLEKLTSFRWIVGIYFLLPALIVAIWWYVNGKKKLQSLFKNCLPSESLEIYEVVLCKILSVAFPALFIVYFMLLMLPYVFDNKFLYYSIQAISTITCAIVLAICCRLTVERLSKARVITEVKKEEAKYRLLTIAFVGLFFLFTGFEFLYLSHIDKTKATDRVAFDAVKIQNKEVIQNAFRLNDLKDGVAATRKKFEGSEERLVLSYKLSLLKRMLNDPNDIDPNINELTNLIQADGAYSKLLGKDRIEVKDTALNLHYLLMSKQIGALLKFTDIATDCTAVSSGNFALKPPPYKIDSVLSYNAYDNDKKTDINLMEKEFSWYETAIPVLKMIEMKLGQLSKRQLTLVLSNVQMKGIFLVSTLIILIGSLFLFLKINKDLLTKQIENATEQSPSLNECVSVNEKLTSSVWIFLNVGIWLLIPLFKPVNENQINIDKPLQMLTFAREYDSDSKEYKYDQSQKTFNDNSVSITLTKEDTLVNESLSRSDTSNVNPIDEAKINEILRRVRKMNSDDDDAIVLEKLFIYLNSANKSVHVDDGTFKNKNKK